MENIWKLLPNFTNIIVKQFKLPCVKYDQGLYTRVRHREITRSNSFSATLWNEAPRMLMVNFLAAATNLSCRKVLTMIRWCIDRTSLEMEASLSHKSVKIFSSGWADSSQAVNAGVLIFWDKFEKWFGNFSSRASTATEESSTLPSSCWMKDIVMMC